MLRDAEPKWWTKPIIQIILFSRGQSQIFLRLEILPYPLPSICIATWPGLEWILAMILQYCSSFWHGYANNSLLSCNYDSIIITTCVLWQFFNLNHTPRACMIEEGITGWNIVNVQYYCCQARNHGYAVQQHVV